MTKEWTVDVLYLELGPVCRMPKHLRYQELTLYACRADINGAVDTPVIKSFTAQLDGCRLSTGALLKGEYYDYERS